MKKNTWIPVVIVLIIVVLVGGYFIIHKSPKTTNVTVTHTSTTSTPTTTTSTAIVQTKTSSSYGPYLANSNGAALYTYSQDTVGVSNCSGSCLSAWPLYGPTSSTESLPANVTIITRSDGTKQYAYKGLPLYTFTGDSNGQITGNGVSGFTLAKP